MSSHQKQLLDSAFAGLLNKHTGGLALADLIDKLLGNNFPSQDVLNAVREKLDSGESGLNKEMLVCLKKQMA